MPRSTNSYISALARTQRKIKFLQQALGKSQEAEYREFIFRELRRERLRAKALERWYRLKNDAKELRRRAAKRERERRARRDGT